MGLERKGRSSCSGQSMAEFIYVLPVLGLLIFGAIQFGLIYHAKATLNLAAFEAARAGALNGGKETAMKLGLANGLRPLFTYGTDNDHLKSGFLCAQSEAGYLPDDNDCKNFSQIEVINPDGPTVAYWKGHIPNDNLMHARKSTPAGISLQDANILKIKVTYCYRMQVLVLRDFIIKLLENSATDPIDKFTAGCYGDLRLPIVAQGVVRMQSDYCPTC